LLYNPTEAAEILGISRSGIFRLMSSGQLESVKIGGLRRIPASALEKYVESVLSPAAQS
jgi:excisionase family DNA binding protein